MFAEFEAQENAMREEHKSQIEDMDTLMKQMREAHKEQRDYLESEHDSQKEAMNAEFDAQRKDAK